MKIYGIRCIYGCSKSVQAREMCKSEYVMRVHREIPRTHSKVIPYVKYIHDLTSQAKRYKLFPKDFIFLFGQPLEFTPLRRPGSEALAGVPATGPSPGAARERLCRQHAGAGGDEASHLLVLSPCSPPRGPVTSGTCHNSQWVSNNTKKISTFCCISVLSLFSEVTQLRVGCIEGWGRTRSVVGYTARSRRVKPWARSILSTLAHKTIL